MRCPQIAGCALLVLLCACGPSAQEKARQQAAERAQQQQALAAMRHDADGSAFQAVGDMMKDKDAQVAMGIGTTPNAAAPSTSNTATPGR